MAKEPETKVDTAPTSVVAPEPQLADETTSDRPRFADLKGVRYVGDSDERRLSVRDLQTLQADPGSGELVPLVFNAANDYTVSKDELTASMLDAILSQPGFEVAL